MKYSASLYDLISRLSANEKRYFRLQASMYDQKESKYLALFDAIVEQVKSGAYDEQRIRKQFAKEPFARQMHVAKNYLHQLICKSLVAYHSQSSVEAKIIELLRMAGILFDKGLPKQSLKKLHKAKKLSHKYHKHLLLAKALEQEEVVCTRILEFGTADKLLGEQHDALENCQNMIFNKRFGVKLYNYYLRSTKSRNVADAQAFQSLIDFDELNDEENAKTVPARIFKYTARIFYENFLGNIDKQYEYQQRIADTFEAHPELIEDNPRHYLVALHNLSQIRFVRQEYTRVLILSERIRYTLETYKLKKNSEVYIESLQGATEFDCWVNIELCDSEAIRESLSNSEAFFEAYRDKLNVQNQMNMLYSMAIGWFYIANNKQALYWLNQIINDRFEGVREDLQRVARFLFLAIHVDLKNYDLLEYNLRSVERYLKASGDVQVYEQMFITFVKQLLKEPVINSKKKRYSEFAKQAEELEPDAWEANFLTYFDMITWARAKGEGIAFIDQKRISHPVV